MAILKIGDREVVLPVYKTTLMARAAPAVDKVLSLAAQISDDASPEQMLSKFGFGGITGLCGDLLDVVAVGAEKADPALTREVLGDAFGLGDLPALQTVFGAILAEAGMGPSAAEPLAA